MISQIFIDVRPNLKAILALL